MYRGKRNVNKTLLLKTLKHFGILAALGAASTVVLGLLTLMTGLNPLSLPVVYQAYAVILIPMAVAALRSAQAEIAKELAQQQLAKAMVTNR